MLLLLWMVNACVVMMESVVMVMVIGMMMAVMRACGVVMVGPHPRSVVALAPSLSFRPKMLRLSQLGPESVRAVHCGRWGAGESSARALLSGIVAVPILLLRRLLVLGPTVAVAGTIASAEDFAPGWRCP